MIIQILLLIVGTYLSMAFTLFFIELKKWDNEAKKMKAKMEAKMDKRDEQLNKMLHLLYKINTYLHNK